MCEERLAFMKLFEPQFGFEIVSRFLLHVCMAHQVIPALVCAALITINVPTIKLSVPARFANVFFAPKTGSFRHRNSC